MTQRGKLEVLLTPLPVGEKRSSPRIPIRVRAYTEYSKSDDTETTVISDSSNASHQKNPVTRRRELARPLKSCLWSGGSTDRSAAEASCARKAVHWDDSDPQVFEVPRWPKDSPRCKHLGTPIAKSAGCHEYTCGVGSRRSEKTWPGMRLFKEWSRLQRGLGHIYVAGGGLIDMYSLDCDGDPVSMTIRHACHESRLGPGEKERRRLFEAELRELDSISF